MTGFQSKTEMPLSRDGDGGQQVYDCLSVVDEILDHLSSQSVLLVADSVAYDRSGARRGLMAALALRRVEVFDRFRPNPTLESLREGLEHFRTARPDVILAVGGGTAIDLAKLIGFCGAQSGDLLDCILSPVINPEKGPPLIVAPTTAGTGSEATHFAVVYVDGCKHSVAHPQLLPDYAIVDSSLTATMPPSVTADTGLDALSQAIESMWSVHSTAESIGYATESIRLAWQHLEAAVRRPTDEDRRAMCRAAHLAGKAINISKTTAPHAISYTITSQFDLPHGRAVALTLGAVLAFNSEIEEADCTDSRGVDYVRKTIDDIVQLLGFQTAGDAVKGIRKLMKSIGCPTRLSDFGAATDVQIAGIVDGVNVQRLANNPRRLSIQSLTAILQTIR
jgi:alcohol dehydrogenase class IV